MAGIKHSEQCKTCHENPRLTKRKRKFEQCEECRRNSVVERLTARRVSRTVTEGGLIQYNEGSGWRVGYLVSYNSTKTAGIVQPIGPMGKVPDTVAVRLCDIKAELGGSPSCPTVQDYYRMNEKKKVVVLVADRRTTAVAAALAAVLDPSTPVQSVSVSKPAPRAHTTADGGSFLDKDPAPKMNVVVDRFLDKPVHAGLDLATKSDISVKVRMKHLPVDLTKARALYENGKAINDIVEEVRGTRASFDVKKLIRKTFKELGILKD
jgi:hypothetical protein